MNVDFFKDEFLLQHAIEPFRTESYAYMNISNHTVPVFEIGSRISSDSVSSVGWVGAGLGVVYTFTSTKHLTAIATFGTENWFRATLYGLRWGCLHAFGVVLIFLFMLSLPKYNLDSFGPGLDAVVGAVTIAFGFLCLWSARRKYLQNEKKLRKTSTNSNCDQDDGRKLLSSPLHLLLKSESTPNTEFSLIVNEATQPLQERESKDQSSKDSLHALDNRLTNSKGKDDIEESKRVDRSDSPDPPKKADRLTLAESDILDSPQTCSVEAGHQNQSELNDDCRAKLMEATDNRDPPGLGSGRSLLQRYAHLLLVLLYGLFDGFAGVSAVLAVIPTLAIHRDLARSGAYMSAFFLTSLLTMALLSAAWTRVAHRFGSVAWVEYVFSLGASLITIAFGVVWEILLSLDLLDDFFG